MVKLGEFLNYGIYYYNNVDDKRFHLYLTDGCPSKSATKVWILHDGKSKICNNKSKIPNSDLSKLFRYIEANFNLILKLANLEYDKIQFYR